MVKTLVRNAIRFRIPLTALIVALTALATSPFAKNFTNSDNSLAIWFEKEDPDYLRYQRMVDIFGHDRLVLIAFELEDVFSEKSLTLIDRVTRAVEKIPDVERVYSLTNAESIEGVADEILIHPLVESIPADGSPALAELKEKAMDDDDWTDNLVSGDGKIASIVARIRTDHTAAESNRLVREIREVLHETGGDRHPHHVSGSPVTDEAFDRFVVRDQRFFLPASVLVSVLILLLFFRNAVVALLPTLLQAVVVVWILGLYHFLGYKMNVVAGMVVPVLIAVCVADSVHVILEYQRSCRPGLSRSEILQTAVAHFFRPCLFTALTTLAGFISFRASSIPPITVLGTLTACGVLTAFVLTLFFLPAVLSWLPEPPGPVHQQPGQEFFRRLFSGISDRVEKFPRSLSLLFVVLIVVSIIGASRITIETNFNEYFPRSDPVRKALDVFNTHLAGTVAYEIMLEPVEEGREIAKDPRVLETIDQFRERILADGTTKKFLSPVSSVRKLNRAFHNNDPAFDAVPDAPEKIAQLYLLAESSGTRELADTKTVDDTRIRLSARTPLTASEKLSVYLEEVGGKARETFEPLGVTADLTGFGPLWVSLDKNILEGQISSFVIAFIVVSLMMMIVLKSVKVGLISMVPNVVPILLTLGVMGFAGIHLNVATVMIAGVTIGITVDDTIYYMIRFRDFLMEERDYRRAFRRTNEAMGTAILFTSCILMGGFGVLCLGSFVPSIYFGALVALTLFLAIFCEILLTPLLILWLKPFKF